MKSLVLVSIFSLTLLACTSGSGPISRFEEAGFQRFPSDHPEILRASDEIRVRITSLPDGSIEKVEGASACLIDSSTECSDDRMPGFSTKAFHNVLSMICEVKDIGIPVSLAKVGVVSNFQATFWDLYAGAIIKRTERSESNNVPEVLVVSFEVLFKQSIHGILEDKRPEKLHQPGLLFRVKINDRWFFVPMSEGEFEKLIIGSVFNGLGVGPIATVGHDWWGGRQSSLEREDSAPLK